MRWLQHFHCEQRATLLAVAHLVLVRPMKRVLPVVLLVLGCLSTLAQPPVRWTREKVIDLHIHLHDPVRIESYSCTRQGFVAVEIGTRAVLTGPLWHWKIVDGRL